MKLFLFSQQLVKQKNFNNVNNNFVVQVPIHSLISIIIEGLKLSKFNCDRKSCFNGPKKFSILTKSRFTNFASKSKFIYFF